MGKVKRELLEKFEIVGAGEYRNSIDKINGQLYIESAIILNKKSLNENFKWKTRSPLICTPLMLGSRSKFNGGA